MNSDENEVNVNLAQEPMDEVIPADEKKSKKNKKRVLIGSIIGAVLVITLLIIFLVLFRNKGGNYMIYLEENDLMCFDFSSNESWRVSKGLLFS